MTAGFEHAYDLGDIVTVGGEYVQIHAIEIGPPLVGGEKKTVQYGGYVLSVSSKERTTSFRWFFEHNIPSATTVGGGAPTAETVGGG